MAGATDPTLAVTHRRETATEGEPLFESTVSVCARGRGSGTPYVTPTSTGAEIIGIEAGDKVRVEVYEDGVFISAKE